MQKGRAEVVTRILKRENLQVIHIPEAFWLEADHVEIVKRGDELIIRPLPKQRASIIFDLLASVEGPIERPVIARQERET